MARARGKYSQAISDRSGVAFPYKQMVKEWNGSFVHRSEYEGKHPQLEPGPVSADAQALENSLCYNRIQLGLEKTKGLGAGADPSVGKEAAEECHEDGDVVGD